GGADAGSSLATAGASSALTSLPTATTTITTTAASTKPTKPATSLHTDIQMPLKPANTLDLLIAHRGAARFTSRRQKGHVGAERRHRHPRRNGGWPKLERPRRNAFNQVQWNAPRSATATSLRLRPRMSARI